MGGPLIITQRPSLQTFLKKDANPNPSTTEIIIDPYSVFIIFEIIMCFRYYKEYNIINIPE
jgi:hypothetical protein